jgi:hypothetical protein
MASAGDPADLLLQEEMTAGVSARPASGGGAESSSCSAAAHSPKSPRLIRRRSARCTSASPKGSSKASATLTVERLAVSEAHHAGVGQ